MLINWGAVIISTFRLSLALPEKEKSFFPDVPRARRKRQVCTKVHFGPACRRLVFRRPKYLGRLQYFPTRSALDSIDGPVDLNLIDFHPCLRTNNPMQGEPTWNRRAA